MDWYISFVQAQPIVSAMVQFAVLGTFGEVVGFWMRRGKGWPFSLLVTLGKMLSWALLAIAIKYAFVGFKGFVATLYEHGMLPWTDLQVIHAFFISFFMNLLFGPFLFISHRALDNLIEGKRNWAGLLSAMVTLLWFWIPAHTITFSLPVDYQIGLAALWSVVLGLMMGFFARVAQHQK